MTAGAFVRACAALVLLCACGAAPAMRPANEASTPQAIWSDVRAVGVQCRIQSSAKLDAETLETALCERVVAIVARDAPVPVSRVNRGEFAVDAAGTVTLLVQGTAERIGDRLAVSVSITPTRPSSRDSEAHRGTAQSRIELRNDASLGSSIDSPLTSALAELLPWKLQRPEITVLTEIH